VTDPKRQKGKPLKYDPGVSDKDLQQAMPGRNTRKQAPSGARDGRMVEIRPQTLLASTRILLMDCFLTYCPAFLEMLSDGLRSEGKHHGTGQLGGESKANLAQFLSIEKKRQNRECLVRSR
jgi:hypothetical protein